MSLTLVEASKMETGDVHRAGIIEQFARSSNILRVVPFQSIAGNALHYNREETLPGIAFRGINESYTEATGVLNPITETLHILGGDMDVDRQIVKQMGAGVRAAHVAMKIKAAARKWDEIFIKGDNATDPREFEGLQNRLTGSQKIAAGSTANGTPLSLAKLDELIDAVDEVGTKYLLMNRSLKRRLSAAARTYTIGGFVNYEINTFGQEVMSYNGVPILTVDQDNEGNEILPFTEAATSGTSTASSIYCVAVGDMGVSGIQNGGIEAYDLGEIDSAPVYRTRVEWATGIAVFNAKSAARLWSISDAAVTA